VPLDSDNVRQWDIKEYESMFFYHNVVTREQTKYTDPYQRDGVDCRPWLYEPELDNGYDSRLELQILIDYDGKFHGRVDRDYVVAMSDDITDSINKYGGGRKTKTIQSLRLEAREMAESSTKGRKSKGRRPVKGRPRKSAKVSKVKTRG
jgi:hypothetical protein